MLLTGPEPAKSSRHPAFGGSPANARCPIVGPVSFCGASVFPRRVRAATNELNEANDSPGYLAFEYKNNRILKFIDRLLKVMGCERVGVVIYANGCRSV